MLRHGKRVWGIVFGCVCLTTLSLAGSVCTTDPPVGEGEGEGEAEAILKLDTGFMDFGGVSTSVIDTFEISNLGSGTLNYDLFSYKTETSFTPVSGTVTNAAQSVTVTLDLTAFEAGPFDVPSIYSDTITVESDGGRRSVEVSAIKVEGAGPVITYVVPNHGQAEDSVTIRGANFTEGEATKDRVRRQTATMPTVFFGELLATVTSSDASTIEVIVPETIVDDGSQDYEVTVVVGSEESAPATIDFTGSAEDVTPTSIMGRVSDGGSPIPNATVEFRDGAERIFAATTNAAGDFQFTPPPPIGIYSARVVASGYRVRSIMIPCRRDLDEVVNIEIDPTVVTEENITSDGLAVVPAGWFVMGKTNVGDDATSPSTDESPLHNVYLDSYAIGKFEITNGEYVEKLNWANSLGRLETADATTVTSNGQQLLGISSIYSQISYTGEAFAVADRDGKSMIDHPVLLVTWHGAVAYCNWLSEVNELTPCYDLTTWELIQPIPDGYRLPTEAEWERAAAWGEEKHWIYGFQSDTADAGRGNYSPYNNPLGLTAEPFTSSVGYYDGTNPGTVNSVSSVGCYDMTGNVWEWCQDWYDSSYYSVSPEANPPGPTTRATRVLRGGSWSNHYSLARTAERSNYGPAIISVNYGFRLARNN
ncbi:SUMF1/EgtB/PvdO family nonheme iron enzyme [Candidatus Hydrogenedentota bacterium]